MCVRARLCEVEVAIGDALGIHMTMQIRVCDIAIRPIQAELLNADVETLEKRKA